MTIDTKRLRELAEAATPGPWIKAGPWPHIAIWHPTGDVDPETNADTTEPDHICDVFRSFMNEHGEWQLPDDDAHATAVFIAAANPQTVIALLDALEMYKAEFEETAASRSALAQQLAAANAEIERLRASHSAIVRNRLADDLVHAEMALERMTAARDEACDIADRHIFAPTVVSPDTTTPTLETWVGTTNPTPVYHDKARIAELRKVGAK